MLDGTIERWECSGRFRNANPTTGVRMRDRRQELAAKEDKHVFAIADMIRLGRQIGFSEVEYVNAYDPPKIGADHQHSLSVQLSRYSVPFREIRTYSFSRNFRTHSAWLWVNRHPSISDILSSGNRDGANWLASELDSAAPSISSCFGSSQSLRYKPDSSEFRSMFEFVPVDSIPT